MFTYHIHRTIGLITDVNSIPLNLPDCGVYSLDKATKFIKDNPDRYNFSHIVDAASGRVIKTFSAQTK